MSTRCLKGTNINDFFLPRILFFLGFLLFFYFFDFPFFLNIACAHTHSSGQNNLSPYQYIFLITYNFKNFALSHSSTFFPPYCSCSQVGGRSHGLFVTDILGDCGSFPICDSFLTISIYIDLFFSSEFLQHPSIHSELNILIKCLQHIRHYTRQWI